jgi:hypothetical protein
MVSSLESGLCAHHTWVCAEIGTPYIYDCLPHCCAPLHTVSLLSPLLSVDLLTYIQHRLIFPHLFGKLAASFLSTGTYPHFHPHPAKLCCELHLHWRGEEQVAVCNGYGGHVVVAMQGVVESAEFCERSSFDIFCGARRPVFIFLW